MKKNYDLIDFWKLFFAISVVALHTGAFRDFSSEISFILFSLISRLAVPFFFCAGGFCCFSKKIKIFSKIFKNTPSKRLSQSI